MATSYTDRLNGSPNLGIKAPVVVATTAAITLSAAQTINGVAVVAGDRVLVKDQASSIDNGIWVCAAGAWSRAKDFNGSMDGGQGTQVFAVGGTVAPLTMYRLTTANTVEIGTDNITWAIAWSADPDTSLAFAGAQRAAAVTMRRTDPTAGDVSWTAYDHTGTLISTSSTTTDGFAEAHTAAQAGNYNLIVEGGGISTTYPNADVVAFLSSTRQTIGPADSAVYDLRGVNFTFAGQGLTSGTALTVDSFSKGRLTFDGQVVCSHAGVALEFRPTSNHSGDANKNQGVATFFFRVVQNASTSAGAVAVKFNAQTGESLNGSEYCMLEVNGGRKGAEFTTAGTGVITDCRFDLWGVHDFLDGAGGIGVDVGTGVDTNVFHIGSTTPASADATLSMAGRANLVHIHEKGSNAVKITLASAAVKNEIHVWSATASGCTVTDNASVKSNAVYFNGVMVLSPSSGSFTPTITFATPGDLSVAYSTQVGTYTRIADRVFVTFSIVTSTFTHTTASGAMSIGGFPLSMSEGTGALAMGSLAWSGITKANYTDVVPQVNNGSANIFLSASGSGQARANIAPADMPTGGTVQLYGAVSFKVA